jgi:hypothetical protein
MIPSLALTRRTEPPPPPYTRNQHHTQDTLTIEAGLDPSVTPPIILALSRRLHHRSLNLTTPDLFRHATLLPDGAISGLDPTHFVVYSDTPAGARQLLSSAGMGSGGGGGEGGWVEAVTKHRRLFQLVHVTDQNATPFPCVGFCGFGFVGGGWLCGVCDGRSCMYLYVLTRLLLSSLQLLPQNAHAHHAGPIYHTQQRPRHHPTRGPPRQAYPAPTARPAGQR